MTRGRAATTLVGLALFAVGFAVAAGLVLAGGAGTVAYLLAITVGFVGIGVTGFAAGRGPAAQSAGPIWAPTALRAVAAALDLPAVPVIAALYVLVGVGVLGNLLPLVRG